MTKREERQEGKTKKSRGTSRKRKKEKKAGVGVHLLGRMSCAANLNESLCQSLAKNAGIPS